ncbi:hypothetical protein C8R42DRAFT_719636 [Lentinula raphanica]|nr:hypothetical protein C8R42DRAFT_719636 [Lentinula raphanica]
MLPILKYVHICLFLSALTAPSAVQPVPLPAPGGHEQTSVQHVPLPVPIDGKTPKQVIDELTKKNLLRKIKDYEPTPEEKHELSKKLSLSSEDYGASYANPVVLRMAGSGEYKGRDNLKVNKKDLVIKRFNTDDDPSEWESIEAILGEVQALRKVGDLVDFGMNWLNQPVIIMRRKDGVHLSQMESFLTSEPQTQQKMAGEYLSSACTKAATIAFKDGVWHNDQHDRNVVIPEFKSVKDVELVDYGETNNFFVETAARDEKYIPIFEKYCLSYWTPTWKSLADFAALQLKQKKDTA